MQSFISQVDLLKSKFRLLEITAELTCGVVDGRKLQIKTMIKPPWAEKRPEFPPESPLGEGDTEPGASAETQSVLSTEQLKTLRTQRGWHGFKEVFMLSSLDREDIETLKVWLRLK